MQWYTWHNHTRAQSHHGTIKIPVVTRGDAHSRQSEAVFITMFFLVLLSCHISWIFYEAGPDLVLYSCIYIVPPACDWVFFVLHCWWCALGDTWVQSEGAGGGQTCDNLRCKAFISPGTAPSTNSLQRVRWWTIGEPCCEHCIPRVELRRLPGLVPAGLCLERAARYWVISASVTTGPGAIVTFGFSLLVTFLP